MDFWLYLYTLSSRIMKKEYLSPALRALDIRFEAAFLQASGTDRADDGYDSGVDLGELQ